jgi:hypothetical protein
VLGDLLPFQQRPVDAESSAPRRYERGSA